MKTKDISIRCKKNGPVRMLCLTDQSPRGHPHPYLLSFPEEGLLCFLLDSESRFFISPFRVLCKRERSNFPPEYFAGKRSQRNAVWNGSLQSLSRSDDILHTLRIRSLFGRPPFSFRLKSKSEQNPRFCLRWIWSKE
ncbi:hypothetical protein AVEN_182328-1 [Araneus ventricosus]|uniref:Uncharacterized protein n=1 Tax=Araneus ventricosus TaxID=182803 RepID=A0A4Y2K9Y7_ARAVE|nr:hypothetical protein AVEN_182328-1 [Araneus ventricosus]